MFKILRTIIFSSLNSIAKIFLEVFVFDKQIRRILKGKLAKSYLKKYVKKACNIQIASENKEQEKETIIWQFWEQGYKNAPDLVLACCDSVEKFKNGNKHILLDYNSIKDYVEIPDLIYELKEKGIIKSAHFSDILRTYLLAQHGGVWVDSTVLFTDNLAKFITNADLFVFQNDLRIDLDGLNMASYFIASKPNNEILERAKYLLNNYWQENNFLNNYFMFLHAFTMISQGNKELKEQFAKIPFHSFIPVQQFQKELLKEYNQERFEQIKRISPIHKLSYKTHVLSKNKEMKIEGTFLEKLIKGELV